MCTSYKITCKKECHKCDYSKLYMESYKFPFNCYRPGCSSNPGITTEPYCGKEFKEPKGKVLKSCKYYKKERNLI